jgi:hypothetical protein
VCALEAGIGIPDSYFLFSFLGIELSAASWSRRHLRDSLRLTSPLSIHRGCHRFSASSRSVPGTEARQGACPHLSAESAGLWLINPCPARAILASSRARLHEHGLGVNRGLTASLVTARRLHKHVESRACLCLPALEGSPCNTDARALSCGLRWPVV